MFNSSYFVFSNLSFDLIKKKYWNKVDEVCSKNYVWVNDDEKYKKQFLEEHMSKINLTTVAFKGTAEQEAQLRAELKEIAKLPGSLMPALQTAQNIYGYLPIEVQRIIAEKTDTSLEEIYGIVTFYSQFKLNPNGEVAIAICLGTACYVKGSGDLLDEFSKQLGIKEGETSADGKYSLEATRCIGACGLAPVLTVNEEVYGRLTPDMIKGILDKYN